MIDLPVLSASQISLFQECKRKWAFKYLDRVEVPRKPGAEIGTEVQDTQLDPYLATGRNFDFSRSLSAEIANALTPLLPRPISTGLSPGLRLRRKFWMPSPTGRFSYQGEFDLWAPDSSIVPGLAAEGGGGRPLLGDIKTIKDLQYAKDREALAVDVQQNLYATAMLYEDGADELDAVWFYARTRRPHRVQRTYLKVLGSRTVDEFGKIDVVGREVAGIKWQAPKANELEPTGAIPKNGRSMCDSFGGCPYRHVCDLSPAVQAAAINQGAVMEAKTNDFLAGLRKTVLPDVAQTITPAPAAATPTAGAAPFNPFAPVAPAALPPWATAPVDPLQARADAAKAAPPVMPVAPAAPVVAINPPESALPPAPPVGIAAPAEAKPKRGRQPKAEASPGEGPNLELVAELAVLMRKHGIVSVDFDGASIRAIEVALNFTPAGA